MTDKPAKKRRRSPLAGKRIQAMTAYMGNPHVGTFAQLKELCPAVADVSEQTLAKWAKEDDWDSHRQEVIDRITENTKNGLASVVARRQQEDLAAMESLAKRADMWLDSPEVMPKSWEGVAKVFMAAHARMSELQESIVNAIDPEDLLRDGRSSEQREAADMGQLSEEELQLLTEHFLQERDLPAMEDTQDSLRLEANATSFAAQTALREDEEGEVIDVTSVAVGEENDDLTSTE